MEKEDRYQQALAYLYSYVNYEHKMTETYAPEKMDPSRPGRLLTRLGNPHQRFPSIHIAGTKGKGSVAAMCASALRSAGLTVGLFTSPHLQDFRERIRVLSPANAEGLIEKEAFAVLVEQIAQPVSEVPGITWFELVTAIAFKHFADKQVDIAVIEVGLGGRLDATNVLIPLVSTITSLSLDHTGLLGNTVSEIAAEKGGIIKPGVPVVVAPQPPEAMTILQEIAEARNAPLIMVGRDWQHIGSVTDEGRVQHIEITRSPDQACAPPGAHFRIPLAGRFQQENALIAIASLCMVRHRLPAVTTTAIQAGLAGVQWPGRLETLWQQPGGPTIVVDCAHNPDSVMKLVAALQTDFRYNRLWFILGFSADKDIPTMLQILLAPAAGAFLVRADHPRLALPEDITEVALELGYHVTPCPDVAQAMSAAWESAGPNDLICVSGSTYIVGDLLKLWDSLQSTLMILPGKDKNG